MTSSRPRAHGRLALLALFLPGAVLTTRAAHADVLVEGYKGVSHELRVEGLGDRPELTFVLYPMGFGSGAAYVSSDQPLPYIKFSAPRLYAIPREGAPPVRAIDEAWLEANAVAVSWHRFSQVGQISEDRPEDRIRTVFRLARIEGRKLVIEGVREELFDRAGKLLERRVPAVKESNPDEAERPDRGAPPAPSDRRGSWAPGRLGGDSLLALPALAAIGLLGATWWRRGGRGLRGPVVALALTLGAAAVARADVPVGPVERGGGVPTWAVAGAAAGASLVALALVVLVRRRGAAK